jgi:hypothetical protein
MIDITHPAVHGSLAALVAHPGYYYLYALYADYPINNAWFREREYAEVLRERLRTLQPLLALVQPYRKSPALRLFTERESLARFPPEKVDEAWRQLRRLIERVGPPAGWPDRPAPAPPPYRAHPPPPPPGTGPRLPAGAGSPARPGGRSCP